MLCIVQEPARMALTSVLSRYTQVCLDAHGPHACRCHAEQATGLDRLNSMQVVIESDLMLSGAPAKLHHCHQIAADGPCADPGWVTWVGSYCPLALHTSPARPHTQQGQQAGRQAGSMVAINNIVKHRPP